MTNGKTKAGEQQNERDSGQQGKRESGRESEEAGGRASGQGGGQRGGRGQGGRGGSVDLNTASAEELAENVEGLGEIRARKIVEHREANGPFSSFEDLKKVEGIDERLAEVIERSANIGRKAA